MKKFDLLFILVLSAFFVFSCSSNDDEEELADTGWNGSSQGGNNSGDTLPEITNDDGNTDTSSENSDQGASDTDTSDTGTTGDDTMDSDDDPDTTTDSGDSQSDEDTADSTDDSDSEIDDPDTDSGDSDTDDTGDTSAPETPFPQCSPDSAKPCILGKLIWSETKKTKLSQGGCNTQCGKLDEGGYSSGWRLPTINELRTLVQHCGKTVSLPEGVCKVSDECIQTSCKTDSDCKCSTGADYSKLGDTDSLWSGTKVESNMSAAWYINFSNAYIDSTNTSDKKSARCVHEIE